jgi:predicted nucleotidyltransferase
MAFGENRLIFHDIMNPENHCEETGPMRIAGIVAEYNPFHNGHARHLLETRAQSRCDAVVAVMSGNFTQRGEPAAFDKWARARMALHCGVDAVFELPAFYALQSADWFACGGVSVLDALGVDMLSFGSESPDIARLEKLSIIWDDEPEPLKAEIRRGIRAGLTHPKARAEALAAQTEGGEAAEALAMPNAVLGAMYLRQIRLLASRMEPLAIRRVGAGYNDTEIVGPIASATAVRRALLAGGEWRGALPAAAAGVIEAEMAQGRGPVAAGDFEGMLLYTLRQGAGLPDTAEGLDNRMRKAAFSCGSIGEFYEAAKCKRYTMARIKRAAMQALLGITAEDISLLRKEQPVYARLLGYSKHADGLINELARRSKIPFIARPAQFKPEGPAMERLWHIDLAASDIFALAYKNPAARQGKRDFTEKMIVICR